MDAAANRLTLRYSACFPYSLPATTVVILGRSGGYSGTRQASSCGCGGWKHSAATLLLSEQHGLSRHYLCCVASSGLKKSESRAWCQ